MCDAFPDEWTPSSADARLDATLSEAVDTLLTRCFDIADQGDKRALWKKNQLTMPMFLGCLSQLVSFDGIQRWHAAKSGRLFSGKRHKGLRSSSSVIDQFHNIVVQRVTALLAAKGVVAAHTNGVIRIAGVKRRVSACGTCVCDAHARPCVQCLRLPPAVRNEPASNVPEANAAQHLLMFKEGQGGACHEVTANETNQGLQALG